MGSRPSTPFRILEKARRRFSFYAFDAPVLAGADLRNTPLAKRREVLRDLISKLPDTIRFSETFDASASELMAQFAPTD
jgi:ATP-dependent DNA ligase